MFNFGKPKCPMCKMEIKLGMQQWKWQNKTFCSEGCKRAYRLGKNEGDGASCH